MPEETQITVSVTDEQLISALKARSYDVFQCIPEYWSKISDDELGAWSTKLRNWSTDAAHTSIHQRNLIIAEIEGRRL
jgi:hypothetical protein